MHTCNSNMIVSRYTVLPGARPSWKRGKKRVVETGPPLIPGIFRGSNPVLVRKEDKKPVKQGPSIYCVKGSWSFLEMCSCTCIEQAQTPERELPQHIFQRRCSEEGREQNRQVISAVPLRIKSAWARGAELFLDARGFVWFGGRVVKRREEKSEGARRHETMSPYFTLAPAPAIPPLAYARYLSSR